jgi:recombinational DNA repair protein RecR
MLVNYQTRHPQFRGVYHVVSRLLKPMARVSARNVYIRGAVRSYPKTSTSAEFFITLSKPVSSDASE